MDFSLTCVTQGILSEFLFSIFPPLCGLRKCGKIGDKKWQKTVVRLKNDHA